MRASPGSTGQARQVQGAAINEVSETIPLTAKSIGLRVVMQDGGLCRFAVAIEPKQWREIGQAFQATEGVWIGAKVGIFCRGGEGAAADFDYFRFAPPS